MRRLCIFLIKAYQYGISPFINNRCRYFPTCSQYAITAIERYGVTKGSLLSIKRILRCHPWGGQGYDPVPNKKMEPHHCSDHKSQSNSKKISTFNIKRL